MIGQKSKQNISIASKNAVTTTATSSDPIHPKQRIAQNYLLIWIDASIDQSKQDCQNTLAQLRNVVNDVKIFAQQDEGGTLGSQIVPLIHDIRQLDGVYIFCGNKSRHEQWTKEWAKIKGVHTEIKPICEAVQLAAKQCNQDFIDVSFVTAGAGVSNTNLNQLEPTFMYTQIFKEILLETEHDEKSFNDFIQFWRKHYTNNTVKLKVITDFEREYCPQSSIRWYTREYFVYEMLNRALRILEADTIINMRFFIRDLHQQLEKLHQNQVGTYHGQPFILYRGQGLSTTNFETLLKSKGGLMSFNNFLSTSKDRDVSLGFAIGAAGNTETVGILFKMTIDPSVSSAPFASIQDVSYFQEEEEILFSMHTVFRIGEINRIDNNSSLYQVDLKLTADDDQELRILTDRIREEVAGATGLERLGRLLIKLKQFNKAEELYTGLLEQTSDKDDKAIYYNQLGYVKDDQGDYEKAIEYYEKALEIKEKTLPRSHPSLTASYNNIAGVYYNMGEYSKALSFYEKTLEILKEIPPPNDPDLATFYNNIGLVYSQMGEYSQVLSFYEKALEIWEKTLPPNHPSLGTSYNNIGNVFNQMGEYSKALSFYKKALAIWEKTLPPNHPLLATSYNNIGTVYNTMGEYSKVLSFYEKALEIKEKTLPPNHPSLATSYNNIGEAYRQMGEYSKALSFYEKDLKISQKILPPNHPDLAASYNNIAVVYESMKEYSKALSCYERALNIWENVLLSNHPHAQSTRRSIERVKKM